MVIVIRNRITDSVWVGWCFMEYQPLLGYLMPNPVFVYVYDLLVNSLLVPLFLNELLEIICLHAVKCFQVLLSNINNSIQ